MITVSIPTKLRDLHPGHWPHLFPRLSPQRPNLSELARMPEPQLPRFVRESAVALKYLHLLGPLDWAHFPERPDRRFDPGRAPLPYTSLTAAYLIKIDQHLPYMADLWDYLVEHPALVWILGFPLVRASTVSCGFDVRASLPTHRHLSRLLRTLPNAALQFLLDDTVRLLQTELCDEAPAFGDCISLDTKHIIAWVKENNPKAYVSLSGPTATPIAVSAANASPISAKASEASNPCPRRSRIRFQPRASASVSTTGATALASSPPKSPTGASSSWPS